MQYSYHFKDTDERTKRLAWERGIPIEGYDAAVWRRDQCGHAMQYSEHANTSSEFGWEIDHIKPRAKGGQTVLENLQPLYWETNRKKGDLYPWNCSML